MSQIPRHLKRFVALIVGGTVLLLGVAMIVLPGPALVMIPLGIVILAAEFAWARQLRRRFEAFAETLASTNDEDESRGRESDDAPR